MLIIFFLAHQCVLGDESRSYVSTTKEQGDFVLSANGKSTSLFVSPHDYPGVRRVLRHLQTDIQRVTGATPAVIEDTIPASGEVVLVGTLGASPLIDRLVAEKKFDGAGLAGKRESFVIEIVERPFPHVPRALVVAGSDKRGTIYGMYDLASQIGVSPWYWWADVPPKKSSSLYVRPGRYSRGEPKVEYRGIFINDEAPALSGWVEKNFGGFNARFYDHVFELILRLNGNFLWPAMWGRAFYDDDPENPKLADEYGVVIGTSHHEPMMRAHDEWRRYGKGGAWNYEKNESALRDFWRDGIRRMGSLESVVTLAMRGDGDEPMSKEANVSLLERIVADQRRILGEVTQKDVTRIPQAWALYKEVEEYYDRGMRVPEDVCLLLCDDNWGNLRKLPKLSDPPHPGGYGIYYHFDFVGGPRNYKWLNTTQIERVWEEMRLAYAHGVSRMWIANVGDIKPMELPISFFLNLAWDPEAITTEDLPHYYARWATEQFGPRYAVGIADILMKYTKFNSRRKPESLDPSTYSLTNYREAERVVEEYNEIASKAQAMYDSVPLEYRDAFYQLVLHQPLAGATLNELYVAAGENRLYAEQGRAEANRRAQRVRDLFARDSAITSYYNNELTRGKWSHMMDQTHIGYTNWQQPEKNVMPAVEEIPLPEKAEMGIAIEGSTYWWPDESDDPVLPEIDAFNRQSRFIEVFNRGTLPFRYSATCAEPWIHIEPESDSIESQKRLRVSVDWMSAPPGRHRVAVTITGPGSRSVQVAAIVDNNLTKFAEPVAGFIEGDGYVSMDADHFTRRVDTESITWLRIPNLGRTGSSMTIAPFTAPSQTPDGNHPRLDYAMHLFNEGAITVHAYISPILNHSSSGGIRYAVSVDDETPQVVNINEADSEPDWKYPRWWNEMVLNNFRVLTTRHQIDTAGSHILKFWMVDPGVVLQRLVVERGNLRPSYLGPPESYHSQQQ